MLPTLFGTRRLTALRAIQTGLYRQYCPDFEKEENNRKNENGIKNSDQRKQNSLVTKCAGLLKSRAVYAAVALTANIKKQADECIRGMLHRWKVRKQVDRTQRRRCFNRLFYWAADKQYLTSLREWSVEATDNDEIAVSSSRDATNSTAVLAPKIEHAPVVKKAINWDEPFQPVSTQQLVWLLRPFSPLSNGHAPSQCCRPPSPHPPSGRRHRQLHWLCYSLCLLSSPCCHHSLLRAAVSNLPLYHSARLPRFLTLLILERMAWMAWMARMAWIPLLLPFVFN